MASLDYAFPAADSSTVSSLGAVGKTIDSTTITNQINKAETDQLFQSLNSSEQNSNTALTYGAYLGRNMTISNIAADLTRENNRVNNGAKDTYTRQSEINEWSAQNKLDTLFFLQILFIYFSVIVVSLFLRQYGMMPNAGLYSIVGVGLLIVVGVLWNRSSYTKYNRDKRHWNRRFVGLDDANLSAKLQCSMTTS